MFLEIENLHLENEDFELWGDSDLQVIEGYAAADVDDENCEIDTVFAVVQYVPSGDKDFVGSLLKYFNIPYEIELSRPQWINVTEIVKGNQKLSDEIKQTFIHKYIEEADEIREAERADKNMEEAKLC